MGTKRVICRLWPLNKLEPVDARSVEEVFKELEARGYRIAERTLSFPKNFKANTPEWDSLVPIVSLKDTWEVLPQKFPVHVEIDGCTHAVHPVGPWLDSICFLLLKYDVSVRYLHELIVQLAPFFNAHLGSDISLRRCLESTLVRLFQLDAEYMLRTQVDGEEPPTQALSHDATPFKAPR
eukprot:Hpha_TRINITY_DN16284_c4_g4::TRINITY_DN16284_c4_g4_i1::g.12881::m.12881